MRLFRAPNSRHPKTDLHKRRFTFDEINGLSLARILELAKNPESFDMPTMSRTSDQAAADWKAAGERVAGEAASRTARRSADFATLNRSTLDFIRDGANQGDRHRLLYSAAGNLAEFGCSPALAHALLTEPALDSGLSPSDVRRQIDCGLSVVPSPSSPTGDAGTPPRAPGADQDQANGSPTPQPTELPPTGSKTAAALDLRDQLARLWYATPAPTATDNPTPADRHQDKQKTKGLPELARAPATPAGAKLFFVDGKMRSCSPAAAVLWTWEGATEWFRSAEMPIPQSVTGGAP